MSEPGAIIVTSTTPLWYLTRATGLVALVLLTLNMACGLLTSVRYLSLIHISEPTRRS